MKNILNKKNIPEGATYKIVAYTTDNKIVVKN